MFLVLIFTRGWVDPRAIVWSEENISLKNPVIPPGIDPVTVRLLTQRLKHYAISGPSITLVNRLKFVNGHSAAESVIEDRRDIRFQLLNSKAIWLWWMPTASTIALNSVFHNDLVFLTAFFFLSTVVPQLLQSTRDRSVLQTRSIHLAINLSYACILMDWHIW
jgi:hypothetical protein